ncbi:DMT family transporter [Marinomonas sp. 2405UD68-3]|uniref:DMT family transporter n=1 Tax=Marinomonas sp. 2405UD68-3 TaxID=3391835 RepID=UPI0039C8D237
MGALTTLFIWAWLMASSFVVSGHMIAYASPIATSAFRFILALSIIFLLLAWQWKRAGLSVSDELSKLLLSRQQAIRYTLISGSLIGFFIGLFTALQYTTPLNTSVLYTLIPLMGVVISRIWLKEALNLSKACGFLIGSLGACVVLFSTQGSPSNHILHDMIHFAWNKGDLIFLVACVLLALHVVSVQKWGKSLPPLPGAFMVMLFGALWLIPIALFWGDVDKVQWRSSGFWINALYLTVFTTLFTFVLQQRLVITVGASRLMAFSYTTPVWVACYTAFSHAQLNDLLGLGFLTGLLLLWLAFLLIEGKRFGSRISIQKTHNSRHL